MTRSFARVASNTAAAAGSPWAFLAALATVVVWAVSGPLFGFSDTWQLVANTGTTIITFLLLFIVQHTQNRDTTAIQSKLDEIVRAIPDARDELIGIEREDQTP